MTLIAPITLPRGNGEAGTAAGARRPRRAAMAGWREYQRLTFVSMTIASKAAAENQAMLPCPRGTTTNAASNGPMADPELPPSWNSDCAKPYRPPDAIRATRDEFGMEDRRAQPDQRRCDQDQVVTVGDRQQQQTAQAAAHGDRQGKRRRTLVGHHADHRLQQRSRHLERQCDKSDLPKVQPVGVLQDRIDRRDQRLIHVIEKVAQAQRYQDGKGGAGLSSRSRQGDGGILAHFGFLRLTS